MSLQHPRSYREGYWFVTVHIHGNCIVLPQWEIRLLTPWLNIPLSHILYYPNTSPCSILSMPSTRLENNKYQFDKSLVWLDWEPNTLSPARKTRALPFQLARLVGEPCLRTHAEAVCLHSMRCCISTEEWIFLFHYKDRLFHPAFKDHPSLGYCISQNM